MRIIWSLAVAQGALLLSVAAHPVMAGDMFGGGSISMGNFGSSNFGSGNLGSGNFSSGSLNAAISGLVSNAAGSMPSAYNGTNQSDFSGLANSGGYGGASGGQSETRGGTAFSFGSGNGNGNGNVGVGNGNGNSGNGNGNGNVGVGNGNGNSGNGNGNGNIGNYNGNNSSGNYNGNRNRGDGNGNNKKTDNNDNDRNWHSHPRKIDIHDNNGKGGNRNGVRAEAAFDRVVVRDAIQQNGILENTQQNNPQNIQEQACRRMGLCQPELRPEDLER